MKRGLMIWFLHIMTIGLDKRMANFEDTDCKAIPDASVFPVFRQAGGLCAKGRGIQLKQLICCAFILFLVGCNNDNYKKKEISKAYKGKIIDKYVLRGTHLKIDTDSTGIIDLVLISGELDENAMVDDSIIKIKDKNLCILKKDGRTIELQYLYNGEQYQGGRKRKIPGMSND
jgi:hypothetical protein